MKRGQTGVMVSHEELRSLLDALNELRPSQFIHPAYFQIVATQVAKWEKKLPENK